LPNIEAALRGIVAPPECAELRGAHSAIAVFLFAANASGCVCQSRVGLSVVGLSHLERVFKSRFVLTCL
jgi:hypothetical protein